MRLPPEDAVKILDLFCGAGGAAMGLRRAFPDAEITGVDLAPMPGYPFRFVQADAMTFPLEGYDLIWASPPCQGYSIMRNLPWLKHKDYPLLIEPTRARLVAAGVSYVIENVMGAQRKARMHAGWLCGTMFWLPFYRHRLFETNWPWMQPGHASHKVTIGSQSANRPRRTQTAILPNIVSDWRNGLKRTGLADWQNGRAVGVGHAKGWKIAAAAMGIDWMQASELTQAVPPAYSFFLGRQLQAALAFRTLRERLP